VTEEIKVYGIDFWIEQIKMEQGFSYHKAKERGGHYKP